MPFFYISAAHKSSGKTTLSVGIAAALAKQGVKIQTFKKGPDYIDPLWLEKASGRPCYNLDFNTMTDAEIKERFQSHNASSTLSLIEGNKGLFDGVDVEGADSNAAMAKFLKAPVILVIDCLGITRGVAPLLIGYKHFDPEITIAGVILNKVVSKRHEKKLRDVIAHYVDIPVLGCVMRDDSLLTSERHLGLIPPEETGQLAQRLDKLAGLVTEAVDLEALRKIAQQGQAEDEPVPTPTIIKQSSQNQVQIGVVRDSSFGFYYADDLAALEQHGAELVFINALKDEELPKLDGLFIGGGFPETHLDALEKNEGLRGAIFRAGQDGLPIYAECGGLMYLSGSITWQGQKSSMVGLIPGDVVMHKKPQGRGLVRLGETEQGLWQEPQGKDGTTAQGLKDVKPKVFKAHEFHYASLENLPDDCRYAFKVERGHGITGSEDGIIINNIQANFSHLRHNQQKPWVSEFLDFVRAVKAEKSA